MFTVGLFALTAWALVKRPAWGFLGACFFAVLAPTSSVFPLKQAAFEHRMYLPLAAVLTALVAGGWLAGRRLVDRGTISLPPLRVLGCLLLACTTLALGAITFHRNRDYRNNLALWTDTVGKSPANPRAFYNLGNALAYDGRLPEAIARYEKALALKPDYAQAHNGIGLALAQCGRFGEAISHYRQSLQFRPDEVDVHTNLGVALVGRGQIDDGISEYKRALQLKPDDLKAHSNLGVALARQGRFDEAIAHYRQALQVNPQLADLHHNLGNALARQGRFDDAIVQYQEALEIDPGHAKARYNLSKTIELAAQQKGQSLKANEMPQPSPAGATHP